MDREDILDEGIRHHKQSDDLLILKLRGSAGKHAQWIRYGRTISVVLIAMSFVWIFLALRIGNSMQEALLEAAIRLTFYISGLTWSYSNPAAGFTVVTIFYTLLVLVNTFFGAGFVGWVLMINVLVIAFLIRAIISGVMLERINKELKAIGGEKVYV